MKSISKFVVAVGVICAATTGVAFAAPCDPGQVCNVPEPTSLALVTVAIAGALWVARKKK